MIEDREIFETYYQKEDYFGRIKEPQGEREMDTLGKLIRIEL